MNSDADDPIPLAFYRTESGNEPVRDWLRQLPAPERQKVGKRIRTVQRLWPVGMPLVRPLGGGLHEVRVRLPNRLVRICVFHHHETLVALHAFFKDTPAILSHDLLLARIRMQRVIQSKHED